MKLSIPNAVTFRVARTILVGQKHSPTILFVGGVAGVVATTVSACRATLKVEDTLVDTQKMILTAKEVVAKGHENYTEQDYKRDLAILYIRGVGKLARLYTPSIVLGVVSIAALTGSHKILTTRNSQLAAAFAVVEKGFAQYRGRVVDELGEDKDREFRYGSETRTVAVEDTNGPKKKKVKTFGDGSASGYARLFQEYAGGRRNYNWSPLPEYNMMFLRGIQSHANQRLQAKGHVFLNEIYEELGFDPVPEGQVVGWLKDQGDNYIDFGIFDDLNSMNRFHDFVVGREGALLLDFNVDGEIFRKI